MLPVISAESRWALGRDGVRCPAAPALEAVWIDELKSTHYLADMPFHALNDDERRSYCRREIEALEHWLRRLVHETFSLAYGPGYLNAVDEGGKRLFRSGTAMGIEARRASEPNRFPRPIDAASLDELVHVICKPEMYSRHFKPALDAAFPLSNEMALEILGRIVDIRNKLSHANPITVHEAARAVCYTQDVLASLKEYYSAMNRQKEYNVPTIIRLPIR